MADTNSPRLAAVDQALPLRPGMRVFEIGCGSGVAARAVLKCIGDGHVLAVDRSAKAIAQAIGGSRAGIGSGRLEFRCISNEAFELAQGEAPFDIAFAVRVGAMDGRRPGAGRVALGRIRDALVKGGRLFIDGGSPIGEVMLP